MNVLGGVAVHYDVAVAQQGELRVARRRSQAVALNRFRNSYCDHMSMADLRWYAAETGKDVEWLFEHGRWADPARAQGTMAEHAYRTLDVDLMELILRHA